MNKNKTVNKFSTVMTGFAAGMGESTNGMMIYDAVSIV